MEIKEFSSVKEAIEALNNIKNIDYSSVEGVDEITEREFYNALMNNLMGTKKLKFTKEERENYKAALRKKGLLTYREWKNRQPNPEEKVTWAESVEQGSLDAPVNVFSHLLQAEDEKKFEYITNVVSKTIIGNDWTKNNEKIITEVKKENNEKQEVDKIITETQQQAAKVVNEIIEEEKAAKVVQEEVMEQIKHELKDEEPIIDEVVELEVEEPIIKTYEEELKEKLEAFKFSTPEDAIEALKTIEKFEYKKGTTPDVIKEKAFYSKIMENLIACRDLKFDDSQAYQYQRALQNLGCKQKSVLNKYRKVDEDISVPEEYINSILQSTRSDHHQAFKAAKSKAKNNEELNEWLVDTQKEVEKAQLRPNNNITDITEYKKPSLFKKVKTYAAIAAASIVTLFGSAKKVDAYSERVNDGNENGAKAGKDIDSSTDELANVALKDLGVTFAEQLDNEVEDHVKVEKTVKKTTKEVDQNYTKAPETHAEVYGEANVKAVEKTKEAAEEKVEAEKAQEKASKESIEIVIESEEKMKKEATTLEMKEDEVVEEKTNTDSDKVVVSVGDNGTISEDTKTPSAPIETIEITKEVQEQDESEKEEAEVDEQGREIIEVEIDF